MNEYEQKLEGRKAYFLEQAAKARGESSARFVRAKQMADCIPFGQPILVGHYSERRDRNFRGRIEKNFRKSFEAQEKAEYYERRAASVGSGGISSDDPDAIDKLEEKLAGLKLSQEQMKAANKAIRACYKAGIREDGSAEEIETLIKALGKAGFVGEISDAAARKLMQPDFCGRRGFPDYSLQNNNANIKRVEARIRELEQKQAAPEIAPQQYEGFEVLREDNRIQIVFDGKPAAEIRDVLKSYAFKWSPSRGAWVRQQTNSGEYALSCVVSKLEAMK